MQSLVKILLNYIPIFSRLPLNNGFITLNTHAHSLFTSYANKEFGSGF